MCATALSPNYYTAYCVSFHSSQVPALFSSVVQIVTRTGATRRIDCLIYGASPDAIIILRRPTGAVRTAGATPTMLPSYLYQASFENSHASSKVFTGSQKTFLKILLVDDAAAIARGLPRDTFRLTRGIKIKVRDTRPALHLEEYECATFRRPHMGTSTK